MPDKTRIVWDSCTIIDYLKGAERAAEHCPRIIEAAQRGEIEIMVSTMAIAEVIKLEGGQTLTHEQEAMIEEFFEREYVIPVGVTTTIAEEARRLSRVYGLKSPDAIHVATALLTPDVRALESYDDDDMDKVRKSSVPLSRPLIIRQPTYEGQSQSFAEIADAIFHAEQIAKAAAEGDDREPEPESPASANPAG